MNGLDMAIIAVISFMTLLGLFWGLIRQVLAVVGLIVGVMLATRFHEGATTVVSSVVRDNPDLASLLGYLLIMLVVSLLVSLVASVLRLFVGLLFLGWADHALGALLGFVQSVILVSVVLAVGTALPEAGLHEQILSSKVAPLFAPAVRVLLNLLPERFELLNQLIFG